MMIGTVAAVTVLSCAMTPSAPAHRQALGPTKVEMNIVLPDVLAQSMRNGENRAMPILFEGEQAKAMGWIVTDAPANPSTPEVVLGRVTRRGDGLQMAWGRATRGAAAYAWAETMQGSCRLAGEEVLK